jgi:hypothetical protein
VPWKGAFDFNRSSTFPIKPRAHFFSGLEERNTFLSANAAQIRLVTPKKGGFDEFLLPEAAISCLLTLAVLPRA